jgi:hypothetical protein
MCEKKNPLSVFTYCVYFDLDIKIYKGNAKFKTTYLFLEQIFKMLSFSLNGQRNSALHVFQLLGGYLVNN